MSEVATENVVPMTPKPQSSYVQVTPEVASRWLTRNHVNRNIRESKVAQYARDMASGNWALSNDAICFAPDGTLLNGQHRLNAVVKSGATITMLIIRNMPPDTMATMDSGAGRTPADVLRFAGERHANILASTLKQLILIDSGRIYMDSKVQAVSRSEQAEFLDAHPSVRDAVACVDHVRIDIDAPPTPLAVANWLIARVNGQELADHFLTQLSRRIGEPEGSAIHAIDKRLREVRRARQKFEGRNYVYLFVKGWNYYAVDKAVTKLQMQPRRGEFQIPAVARWRR